MAKVTGSIEGPDNSPLWRFTINSTKKVPLDQLWRWPECFALIGLKFSVPMEACERELTVALERSKADRNQVDDALKAIRKIYGKYALGEDRIDKRARDNIKGCGLKVGEDFLVGRPLVSSKAGGQQDEAGKERKWSNFPEGELWMEDGEVGFSIVRDGKIITRTISEWREAEPAMAALIEEWYAYSEGVYYLPGRPDTEHEDKTLLQDIMAVLDRFVDLPPGAGKINGKDSPYRTSTAAHITCTAFHDLIAVRPGLIVVAETTTGKTRMTTICAKTSYRGYIVGRPTEALILRALGTYHVTLCVDEAADIPPDVLVLILTIYKLSFDGLNIGRCDNNDQRRIINYPCKGFVTLSLKSLERIKDDHINRGVTLHMGYKTRDLEDQEPSHPMFESLFLPLRTRITALRLRALAGKIDIPGALDRAQELAKKKYNFEGKEYGLESRNLAKAVSLLLPIVLMGEDKERIDDIMEVMLRSKFEGDKAQSQSLSAKCWFALYEEVTNLYSNMSVQQVSRGCAIPIAVAYRRVAKMEEFGLVKCVGFEEVYRGKKVSYYECAVNMAKVTFAAGKFDVEIDFLPESELSHIGNAPILDESEGGEDA